MEGLGVNTANPNNNRSCNPVSDELSFPNEMSFKTKSFQTKPFHEDSLISPRRAGHCTAPLKVGKCDSTSAKLG